MSDRYLLSKQALGPLFAALVAGGQRILAPVKAGPDLAFGEVTTPEQVVTDAVQTATSAKTAVFPRYEALLRFKINGKDVDATEVTPDARPTVLFGVRPCDAASLATLKAVFTWDSPDAYFEPRLAALTVIGLSCTHADAYCFCTSVGGSPGDTRGSDLLLTPIDATRYLAEVLTEKGAAVQRQVPQLFTPADSVAKENVLADVKPRFALDALKQRLPKLFNQTAAWQEQSLRCLGCGACAFVCPTCTCFDIQDERNRYAGVRLRSWDACGFAQFTLHASGHNPRHVQAERWRQRVMHKFSYQPERLGVLGCVGCGRCSRACPADMNLAEHVQSLAEMTA